MDPQPIDVCRTCRKTIPRVKRQGFEDVTYVLDDTQKLWCSQLCERLESDARLALDSYTAMLNQRRLGTITEGQLREERYRLRMAFLKVEEAVLHIGLKGKEWHDTADLLDRLKEDLESGWIIEPASVSMVAA